MRNLIGLMFTFVFVLVLSFAAHAGFPYQRGSQDMKLPSQAMVEHQSFAAPAAAGTNQVLSANAGQTSSATATVTTFLAQPDVPRNLVITPAGTTADVTACSVVVNGTNIYGAAISENFAFANTASSATTGAKAFKSITSIVFGGCEGGGFGATWSVGFGSKLGLKRCLAQAGDVAWAVANGAYEATRPTVASAATAVESNTVAFNTAPDGSKNFDLYFVQNFRCSP